MNFKEEDIGQCFLPYTADLPDVFLLKHDEVINRLNTESTFQCIDRTYATGEGAAEGSKRDL